MSKKILLLLSFILVSCGSKKESPVIYFSNLSPAPISNIHCEWVGKNKLNLPVLNPGDTRSQSFYIRKPEDFFGQISISWNAANGQRQDREFVFNKNNLPSIADSTTYNYVQFYLDQNEVEIMTSDAPDLSGKSRKMDRLLGGYRQAYLHGHLPAQTPLISVEQPQPKKDNSVPSWLLNSF